MPVTANITWNFALGSYGTTVEYKLSSSSTWITPSSPANPTLDNEYPLVINEDTYYDVRLTSIGANGPCTSITKQIIYQSSGLVCCPPTYTLAIDNSYCYKYIETPATPPVTSENLVKKSYTYYGEYGTLIYSLGYNLNGSGSNTEINNSNLYWINSIPVSSSKGPLNRTAVWSTSELGNQTVGYSVCVNVPSTKTYYVGVGADNSAILKLDGVEFLNMIPSQMSSYLSANGYPGTGVDCTFKFWHIYPITITAGFHILELIGFNVSDEAAFGVQVYDATAGELEAVTDSPGLAPYLVFSSETEVGNAVQLGSDGIGYSCPLGTSLVLCDGSPKCREFLTTSTIPC